MSLKRDLLHALDAGTFARDDLGLVLDDWQKAVLRDPARRIALNVSRQGGKSTVSAIKALHRAVFFPKSLVLLIAPSQRQSVELFRKITDFREDMDHPPRLIEDNKSNSILQNKSRIVALPGSDATIRGFSAPALVIADEASRVPDTVFAAIRPMLAVSGGSLVLLSTPFGKRGFFYRVMTNPGHWSTYTVPATRIPRISPEFLVMEKTDMFGWEYSQEYECEFVDLAAGLSVFNPADWTAALSDGVKPYNFERLLEEAVTS